MRHMARLGMIVVTLTGAPGALAGAGPGDDKAAQVMAAAREALGGAALDDVKALSASGEFRRMMGERELNGEITIQLIAPDKIKRTEEMGIPGGPRMSRVTTLNAGEFWEDATNRGGFMMRMGPGGGGGQAPSEADRERFRQMQQRRLEGELRRHLLVWLMRTDAPVTYAGEAEAEDGKADVLEVLTDGAPPMRLFIDQETRRPLMLTYQGVMPRMVARQGGGAPPDPEEMRRRMAEPPRQVTFEVRYSDYKSVKGVMLPHLITQSVEGRPTEEWTVSEFKLNPPLKPEHFLKK
jgi:hypothetical protein